MSVTSRERARKFQADRMAQFRKREEQVTRTMSRFLQAGARVETARTRLATAETAQGNELLKLVDEFKVSVQEIAAACDVEPKEIRTMLKAARSSKTNDDQQKAPSQEPEDSPTPSAAPTAAPDDESPRS